jgi:predicted AAA+ superfamily ATPase
MNLSREKMDRVIHKELVNWKNGPNRKPLLIQGARQVGKTYAIKTFGKSEFSQCIYLNFDENPEYIDSYPPYANYSGLGELKNPFCKKNTNVLKI